MKTTTGGVENMGYPMNSPFDDFGIAYVEGEDKGMFTSNRKGSRGDDIYEFVVPPKIYRAEGEVFDKENGTHIDGATIRIIGTDGTSMRLRTQNGKFQMTLKPKPNTFLRHLRTVTCATKLPLPPSDWKRAKTSGLNSISPHTERR